MNSKAASKNQLKSWKKLLAGKYRKKEGLFLAEGLRCVEQIVENGIVEVKELLIEDGFDGGHILNAGIPVFTLNKSDFSDVSDTETPQGVIAVCTIPDEADLNSLANTTGVITAYDAIQDPGNLGTMIRTSAWFGAKGIISGAGTADIFNPKTVRSTAGATGVLPFITGRLDQLLKNFENAGWTVYLMDGGTESENIQKISPAGKSIIVIGNEGSGISGSLFTAGRKKVKIEGEQQFVESLNASVACGIALSRFCL